MEPLYKFELLGLLVSLAVYNGLTLPFAFPMVLYAKLLNLPCSSLDDIRDGWGSLVKGLKLLLDWPGDDVEKVFLRSYVFSVDVFGNTLNVDMDKIKKSTAQQSEVDGHHDQAREGGGAMFTSSGNSTSLDNVEYSDQPENHAGTDEMETAAMSETTMVTNANREDYVRDYVNYLTNISVEPQYEAFAKGFFQCITPKSISLFQPSELKDLVEGVQIIDIDDLERVTKYAGGYDEEHPVIICFWHIVRSWPKGKVRQLLEFVTASDRLPVQGSARLEFEIQKNGEGDARLPTSSTCYGKLLLPAYNSEERLRAALETALEHSKGFGQP